VPWVGSQAFHVDITVRPNGSGDTTYNYVQVFSYLVLALAAALVWTLLDRRRPAYERLHEWLRVYVRFYLAMTMFSYGIVKVIQLQFPSPALDRLLQTFGTSSPMGLLWTFMGASALYTFFAGASEVLGGLLLTTRRTTLLGALVSIGVLTNVVMLNFSYDVPVKLFSSHLLAMAVFLAAPDLRRLAGLFLFNRPAVLPADRPLFARRWSHQGTLVLRTAAVSPRRTCAWRSSLRSATAMNGRPWSSCCRRSAARNAAIASCGRPWAARRSPVACCSSTPVAGSAPGRTPAARSSHCSAS